MGAKQSKRSVDISGKEAEGGEVAAAGAGGEGRMEPLADADVKTQLNGDATHILEQTDKEKQLDSGTPENEKDATTEKETKGQEKESESEKEKEKEAVPVTNGESESKAENGDSSPAPEEGKKPKKEKVKKKWSLRSISFSRKDKPKQEKKQKEEEPKTNGEPEKVPEEAAEATPETTANEVAQEAKPEAEIKDEKTPETPVTEPLTNGSSTPESPKVESPVAEEPAPAAAPVTPAEAEKVEPKPETQPEQLPVNGLSLEEPTAEVPEVAKSEESKPEEPTAAESPETVPAPEIPVKKEVCVEQMPLESSPPPLPANPPPSSVASFAATTMAPELTDASLPNTAELVSTAPPTVLDVASNKTETIAANSCVESPNLEVATNDISLPLKDTSHEIPAETKPEIVQVELQYPGGPVNDIKLESAVVAGVNESESGVAVAFEPIKSEVQPSESEGQNISSRNMDEKSVEVAAEISIGMAHEILEPNIVNTSEKIENSKVNDVQALHNIENTETNPDNLIGDISNQVVTEYNAKNEATFEINADKLHETQETVIESISNSEITTNETNTESEAPVVINSDKLQEIPDPVADLPDPVDDLPPPPPPLDEDIPVDDFQEAEIIDKTLKSIDTKQVIANVDMNGGDAQNINGNSITEQENLKNLAMESINSLTTECNGDHAEETEKQDPTEAVEKISREEESMLSDMTPPSPSEPSESAPAAGDGSAESSEALPPPPTAADLCDEEPPQEPLPVSDKLADLIPEVPVVPELKNETETTSDVPVSN